MPLQSRQLCDMVELTDIDRPTPTSDEIQHINIVSR